MKSTHCLAALLLSALTTHAGLRWETKETTVAVETHDKEAVGHYPFVNDTDHAIKITALKTNCGCTAASAGKESFAPGERGEVTVTYRVGQRRGFYETPITVKTDALIEPDAVLALRLLIRDAVEVKPQVVFWRADEKPEPKNIRVEATAAALLKEVNVSAADPAVVRVEPQPIKGKRTCEIRITPAAASARGKTQLTIEAELSNGEKRTITAQVRVR
jgi:hypothetical protein